MLKEVLRIVAQGGIHTRGELARRLDVSEELLQQMIEELERLGYLKPVAGDCHHRCAGCPFATECAIGGAGRIWALTEKGLRASDGRHGQSMLHLSLKLNHAPHPPRSLSS